MADQVPWSQSSPMQTILLKHGDSGKDVEAHVGDTIVVSLNENPSTGYKWEMERDDEQIVQMQGSEFRRIAREGVIGAAGERILSFQMKKAGRVTVRLKLRRAWEDETSAVERFFIPIEVKP